MSLSLSNVQQTEFDALVKVEYRSRGFLLRETVRIRTDVIGNTCQFRKIGQVIANAVAYQNTIAIQDPGFTAQTATLIKYAAGTAVDEIQDLTVNFDTKRELAIVVAMAIGRRADQIIIDALGAGGSAQATIAAGGTNMSYAKLRNVLQYFEQDAVPIGERFIAMSGNNLRALCADDHIISRFYTSNDLVVNGDINYKMLLSMQPVVIPDMTEGGLPLGVTAANVRNCYAWHKMAMGMAIGQDMRTEVNYLPRETSWFVNGLFFAGAVTVDNRGVFFVNADESVNP
jgi:hypothetical protein